MLRNSRGAGFYILPLFIFVSLLFSAPFDLTIGFYFAGDNNLQDEVDVDLSEIKKAFWNDKINVVVFADRGYYTDNPGVRIYIKRDTSLIEILNLGDLDSGSGATLRFFTNFLISNYPSKCYGLVIWGHGTSWTKGGDYFTKSVAYDASSGNAIQVFNGELKQALPDSAFEFIVFDACLMGSIEVLWELKNKAHYVLASPALVPSSGLDYGKFLNAFSVFGDSIVGALCKVIDDYVMENDSLGFSVCLSLYDLSKLGALKTYIERMNELSYINGGNTLRKWRSGLFTYNLYSNEIVDSEAPFVDLKNLLSRFLGEDELPFILYSKGSHNFLEFHHIHIYFPVSIGEIKFRYLQYSSLDFERETGFFDAVLNTFRDTLYQVFDTVDLRVVKTKNATFISALNLLKPKRFLTTLEVYRNGHLFHRVERGSPNFELKLPPGEYHLKFGVKNPYSGEIFTLKTKPETLEVREGETDFYVNVVDSLKNGFNILGRRVKGRGKGINFLEGRKFIVF